VKTEISFRVKEHMLRPGVQILEILAGGEVCGVIYPGEGKSITLVSAHFAGMKCASGAGSIFPIPSVSVAFNPSPYKIEAGKIVKLPRRSA